MSRTRVAILGSTGSIGTQTVDVAKRYQERIEVVALSAHSSAEDIVAQAIALDVPLVALTDPSAAARARHLLDANSATLHRPIEVVQGASALTDIARESSADLVLNALVGAAGLEVSVATLTAGKTLALANKESLVVGGRLVTELAKPGQLLPVDSEHSAIFQCYLGEAAADVSRIWLTASGGPFRGCSRHELESITARDALAHPTWSMGPKITIDSATLMNKGLEAIEAHHLFEIDYDRIAIVVHPQSCIHSMIEFIDGSVKAHLGPTDMRIPIQYALSYPDRWDSPITPVDFTTLGSLDFEPADTSTFRCLSLALEAGRIGESMPIVLNAANEIAVEAFLAERCSFTDIDTVVASTMAAHDVVRVESIDHIIEVDAEARRMAATRIVKAS